MTSQVSGIIALVVVGFSLYLGLWKRRASRLPLPPGPPSLPIIGSALSIPRDKEWYTFTRWAKEYGPVVYFKVLGREFVVLNSVKAVNDLFGTRGANYATRPSFQMLSDLTGYDKITAFMPLCDRLVNSRKLIAPFLLARAVDRWHPEMEYASQLLMYQLLDEPLQLYKHILLYAGTLILKISHGYIPLRAHDPLIDQAEKSLREVGSAFDFGAWWVEFFPWLRYVPEWFPGAGWKRKASAYKINVFKMVEAPHEIVKERMKNGTAVPSFTSELLDRQGGMDPAQQDVIMWAAHALYAGGTDTSVVAAENFFLLMTLHPEIQRKCQQEIESVVGRDRLPGPKDKPQLPYVAATCKEILRWHPVAPIALPHATVQDDVYEGYHIPKGTTIWGNAWLLLHNETLYPDPHTFKPERFLGPNPQPDPKDYGSFGFGRRKCPAADFAETALFTLMVTALSTFDIERELDANGKEIVPTPEHQHRIIPHPLPFPTALKVRSQTAADLIRRAVCAAD